MHLADTILTSSPTPNSTTSITPQCEKSSVCASENSTTNIDTKKRKTITLKNDSQQQHKQAAPICSKTDWSAQVKRILEQNTSKKKKA